MNEMISLEVNGRVYQGWKSAQVVSGIGQIATQFALSVTEKYPGGSTRIRPGDLVVVKIGKETVCTGYVDKTPISYNATSITHNISGRSRTADLVDCCIETSIDTEIKQAGSDRYAGIKYQANGETVKTVAPTVAGSEWRQIDIEKVIATLIKPYGIALKTSAALGKTSGKISVSIGEKVSEAIKKLIKKNGFFATDNENGDLVIWDKDLSIDSKDKIVSNGQQTNVLEGSCQFNYENVYSQYLVFGQSGTSKTDSAPKTANVLSDPVKSSVLGDRHRVLKVFQSGKIVKKNADDRAEYEKDYREANAKTVTYKLCGWTQSDGSIWRKGMTVQIADDLLGFKEKMIISKITYDLNASGTTTTLELSPADAFLQKQDSWSGTETKTTPKGGTSWEGVKRVS